MSLNIEKTIEILIIIFLGFVTYSITITQTFLSLSFILLLFTYKKEVIDKVKNNDINLPLFFFFLSAVISLIFHAESVDPFISAKKLKMFPPFAAYYFFIIYRPALSNIKKYYYVIIGAFCVSLFYIILQHYLGKDILSFRYSTFQWDRGTRIYPLYGQFSSIILMIILPVLLFSKNISKNERSFLVFSLLPIFLAIYLSFSRTSVISLIISISVMLFLKKKKVHILVILIAIIAVTLFHVKRGDNNLLTSIVDLTSPQNVRVESNRQRITMLEDFLDIIKKHPLTGIGFNGYKQYRPGFHDKIFNDYLGVLATMGILGLIPFLWLIAVFFKGAYLGVKLLSSHLEDDFYALFSFGIFLSFISFLSSAFLESIFFNSEPLMLILLLMSINKLITGKMKKKYESMEGECSE